MDDDNAIASWERGRLVRPREAQVDDDNAIAGVLGLESAFGYHLESGPRLSFAIPVRDCRVVSWYPCLAIDQTYTGCLGEACPLEVCWTGGASVSYEAALRRRFHPTDVEYAPGARCLLCRHVQEMSIVAIDARQGLIHLPMVCCEEHCWRHPISSAAFVRRRIPCGDDRDLAHCPAFEQAAEPIPAVERQRVHVNERARALRACRAGRVGRQPTRPRPSGGGSLIT